MACTIIYLYCNIPKCSAKAQAVSDQARNMEYNHTVIRVDSWTLSIFSLMVQEQEIIDHNIKVRAMVEMQTDMLMFMNPGNIKCPDCGEECPKKINCSI